MKRSAIRLSLILGSIAVVLILLVQVYFVQRAFDEESNRLNQSVQVTLRTVAQHLALYYEVDLPNENPVRQIRPDYYVVNVNTYLDAEVLEHYLITEFAARSLRLDFEFGIYDCSTDQFQYGRYVTYGNTKKKAEDYSFIAYPQYLYYFGIYFPGRRNTVVNELGIWYFFSAVLLIVVVFFIFTQVVILRQRRLSEIQHDFINNLTHELRTPLSSIQMSSEVILTQQIAKEPERLVTYGRIIHDQSNHLIKQIDRVLNQSQVGVKRQNEFFKTFNISEMIQDVQAYFIPLINPRSIIKLDLPEESIQVHGDPDLIRQVIINLIDNSIKYSGDQCFIKVSLLRQKKYCVLQVQDQGMGIPSEYQYRVFNRFFRVPSGNVHDVKGFGLGLHYVKRVLKKHHWSFTMRSIPGKGTTIRIQFKEILHGKKA